MKTGILLWFLCATHSAVSGQVNNFKAQVLYKNEVLKNYTLLIDGAPATTDFSGVLRTIISNNKTQLRIQPQDKRHIVLYPRGGNMLVPKDNTLAAEIILGSYAEDPNLKMYNQLLKEISTARQSPGANLRPLQQRLDSIESMLTRMNYTNEELGSAKQRQDGIDLFYPAIRDVLNEYIVDAIDLKNAFKYISDFAFKNREALEKLKEAVEHYNQRILKLNSSYPMLAKKIADYWQSDSLSTQFSGIAEIIINDIHKPYVLPLNEIKNRINQYNHGQISGTQQQAQIKEQIAQALPPLTGKLEIIEKRINEFIHQLTNF